MRIYYGQKINGIVIGYRVGRNARREITYLCRCFCLNYFTAAGTSIRTGNVSSCGCLRRKHGHATRSKGATSTYMIWGGMIKRCTNPKSRNWKWYGGRGIQVCVRWRDFRNFLKDMGIRPKNRSLDRFPNPDGNYCVKNCRWATRKQQRHNQSVRYAS
jgi:hypothetical protein